MGRLSGKLFSVFAGLLLVLSRPGLGANEQPNLLQNGNFETAGGGSSPASWLTQVGSGSATLTWDTAKFVSGARSVKTVMATGGQVDWRQWVAIDPTLRFRVRAHVYATNVAAGAHALEVQWYNGSVQYLGRASFSSPVANQWMEVIGEDLVPPAGTVQAVVVLRTYQAGTYWFDDVVLQRQNQAVAPLSGGFPMVAGALPFAQLLTNNDFEVQGNGNFPTYWYRWVDNGTVNQMWYPFATSGYYSAFTQMSTDGQADWRQLVPDIDPSWTYDLSGSIYASKVWAGSHAILLQWLDANGAVLGSQSLSSTLANNWKYVQKTGMTPPSGTTQAMVMLRTYKSGTYWFDNISLTPTWTASLTNRFTDIGNAGFSCMAVADQSWLPILEALPLKAVFALGSSGLAYLPTGADPTPLTNVVNSVKGSPAVVMWCGADEPCWNGLSADGVVNAYNLIKQLDAGYPGGPRQVWVNHAPLGSQSNIGDLTLNRPYNPGLDLVSMDIYPFPEGQASQLPNKALSCVGDLTDILYNQIATWDNSLVSRYAQRKPMWMYLQGCSMYDWFYYGTGLQSGPYLSDSLELQWCDGSGTVLRTDRLASDVPNEWRQVYEQSITPPTGAVQVRVVLRTYGGGTFYFDDVSFGEVGGPNLVLNPNMETGSGSSPANWTTATTVGSDSIQFNWATDTSHSSGHSLKILMTMPVGNHAGSPSYWQGDWRQLITGISATKKYTFSAWVNAVLRPTWTATRFMAYQSIIHGARGLVYFGIDVTPVNSQLWKDLKRLASELNGLTNALLSPTSFRSVSVDHPEVETVLLNASDGLYLLAANRNAASAGNVTLTVSGLPLATASQLYETGTFSLVNNSWVDSFGGYQVHVYKIMPAAAVTGTVLPGDYLAPLTNVAVTVQFLQNSTVVKTANPALDAQGRFSVAGVDVGTYDVSIKGPVWLRKVLPQVTIASPSTDLGMVALINGDSDGDNVVTTADLSIVLANMDTALGSLNWDGRADLDGDGQATSTDIAIVLADMGMGGDN